MKRICLFAGYDKNNIIDDYVVYYISELAKFSDVYYFADNDMNKPELDKLKNIAKFAAGRKHGCYDFGSWLEIIKEIGWKKIEEYDEVILANDGCFGPLFPLDDVFDTMESKKLDAWAMCGNKFMMSFFMVLNKKVFKNKEFRAFFENIKPEADKNIVIKKYERGINSIIEEQDFSHGVFLSGKDLQKYYKKHKKEIRQKLNKVIPVWIRALIRFKPNKIRLYENDFILPLFAGMPIMKKISFGINGTLMPCFALKIIKQNSDYPVEIIEKYFTRIGIDINKPADSIIWSNIKQKIRNFISDKKYRKNKFIIRIFTIPVYVKKMDYKN